METNVMKTFSTTPAYRVCVLVLSALDVNKVTGRWAERRGVDHGLEYGAGPRVSLLASQHSSQLHDVEPSRAASMLQTKSMFSGRARPSASRATTASTQCAL